MPIIILEGPDGAGKSELAKELLTGPCKDWKYYHNGTYEGMKGRELFQLYTRQILEGRHDGILLDRSFDSERIYGKVMRGEDRIRAHGQKLLNRLCSAMGAIQIVCLPPKAVAEANWQEKMEDYLEHLGDWNKVYYYYEELLKDPRYVRYDYTWCAGRTRKDLLLRFSTMIKIVEGGDWLPEGYVGSPTAKYLFVGEQVNVKKAWVDLPFFDVRGVSVYLAEVLEKAGIKEEDCAFVNCWNQDHELNVLRGKGKRVIALGRRVHFILKQSLFDHRYLPHPNYVRRFNQKRTYVRKLKAVLA